MLFVKTKWSFINSFRHFLLFSQVAFYCPNKQRNKFNIINIFPTPHDLFEQHLEIVTKTTLLNNIGLFIWTIDVFFLSVNSSLQRDIGTALNMIFNKIHQQPKMFRLLLFGHKNLKTLAYNCYFSKDNSQHMIIIYPRGLAICGCRLQHRQRGDGGKFKV